VQLQKMAHKTNLSVSRRLLQTADVLKAAVSYRNSKFSTVLIIATFLLRDAL